MSDEEKIETKNLTANKVAATNGFAAKIDSGTLITSIQKDLLRVHDFAMSQDRSTTFVLSDFTLQLKAVVTQEGEKTMFALPTKSGEIDPNLMSTLNLTLKPIPLAVKPVTSTRPVEAIEGIGPILGARLRDIGINTVSDLALVAELLVVAAKIDSKEKLAEASPEELTNTLNEAIKAGKVKVPKSFHLTTADSTKWVDSAKTLVDRSRALGL
jgi:hypothetical protein